MSLEKEITEKLKAAMKAKDQIALRSLRAIKSEIMKEKTKEGGNGEMTDEAGMKILTKMAKQRRDSISIFKEQGRDDLAQTEQEELDVIAKFLPEQMGEAEVTEKVKAIIAKVGASSPADIGKVMGVAMKELAGKADGKLISTVARNILSNQ